MRTFIFILIAILGTCELSAQSTHPETDIPNDDKKGEWIEIPRKISGLKLEISNYTGSAGIVRVKREDSPPFDTLYSLDVKDVDSWSTFTKDMQTRVFPDDVRERLDQLGKEDVHRALGIHAIMEIDRDSGRIMNYILLISKIIVDRLSDDELAEIWTAFGKERIDPDLIEFRVLTAEQEQEIREKSYGRYNTDPFEIVPINKRKLVDRGILSVPVLQLNMRTFFTVKLPAPVEGD